MVLELWYLDSNSLTASQKKFEMRVGVGRYERAVYEGNENGREQSQQEFHVLRSPSAIVVSPVAHSM